MNPWTSNYKSHQGNVGLGRAIAYYIVNLDWGTSAPEEIQEVEAG